MSDKMIKFGLIGIGGYSKTHIKNINEIAENDANVRIAAAAVRNRAKYADAIKELEGKGVRIVDDPAGLLAMKDELDVVCVPTGIDTHVPLTIPLLEAGMPVIMEKPVSGSIDEAVQLIEAQRRTGTLLLIGYQRMYDPLILRVKRDLASGVIGKVREIRARVMWPRNMFYYNRNPWAGELKAGGSWVLDCPFNNACAHYVTENLFFAGVGEKDVAVPARVRAELYRAHPISSCDTGAIEVETTDGVRSLFLTSHATEDKFGPEYTIIGEEGRVVLSLTEYKVIKDGVEKKEKIESSTSKSGPFVSMVALLRGDSSAPVCSVEMASRQTVVSNGAFMSSRINDVPKSEVYEVERSATPEEKTTQFCARGMFEAFEAAYNEGVLPALLEDSPDWMQVGEWVDVSELSSFPGVRG